MHENNSQGRRTLPTVFGGYSYSNSSVLFELDRSISTGGKNPNLSLAVHRAVAETAVSSPRTPFHTRSATLGRRQQVAGTMKESIMIPFGAGRRRLGGVASWPRLLSIVPFAGRLRRSGAPFLTNPSRAGIPRSSNGKLYWHAPFTMSDVINNTTPKNFTR